MVTESLFPGTAMSATVGIAQIFYFIKDNFRLVLHNAELTDSVIYMYLRVTHRIDRHKPLVVVSIVRAVNHTLVVRLDNAEILESGAAGDNMRLIPYGKLHGNP